MTHEELEKLRVDLNSVFNSAALGKFEVEIRGAAYLVKLPMGRYVPKSVIDQIESLGYSFMTFQGVIESGETFLGITIGGKKK